MLEATIVRFRALLCADEIRQIWLVWAKNKKIANLNGTTPKKS